MAIQYMHLNCLKYAISNGCVFDEKIFIELASKNNLDAIKYVSKRFSR